MKFPIELSKERLSLLSPEDRAIYEQEWNSNNKSEDFLVYDIDYINFLDEDFNADEIANRIVEEEMNNLYEELFADSMSIEEFEEFKKDFNNLSQLSVIQEGAEGLDAGAWIKSASAKLGWLGKLAGLGLAGLATGITALVVAGKDKLAIAKLKYFMNRLVELTDQGVHKKRPWYSFLIPSKKKRNNLGEYNMGCFRMEQETADRNMTVAVMQAAHKLGYFKAGEMMNIRNGEGPQPGGGLDAFNQNVLGQLNVIL